MIFTFTYPNKNFEGHQYMPTYCWRDWSSTKWKTNVWVLLPWVHFFGLRSHFNECQISMRVLQYTIASQYRADSRKLWLIIYVYIFFHPSRTIVTWLNISSQLVLQPPRRQRHTYVWLVFTFSMFHIVQISCPSLYIQTLTKFWGARENYLRC